jgi:carbamoyltransferase
MGAAFLVSPYKEAAVLSVDGMGDFVSTMWATGKENTFNVHDEINFPHSLGYFYTAFSQWLGFMKYGDEGKVMGLAPCGEPIFMNQMRDIVKIQRDGTFELNLDYFIVQINVVYNEPEMYLLFIFKSEGASNKNQQTRVNAHTFY